MNFREPESELEFAVLAVFPGGLGFAYFLLYSEYGIECPASLGRLFSCTDID